MIFNISARNCLDFIVSVLRAHGDSRIAAIEVGCERNELFTDKDWSDFCSSISAATPRIYDISFFYRRDRRDFLSILKDDSGEWKLTRLE